MDFRLFIGTFVLIFLAELGDKTQLATFARAASESAPWSVFLGASCALVLSTLVAVLLGGLLNAIAPPHIIQGAAGILFMAFGILLLSSAFRAEKAAPPEEPEAAAPAEGWLAEITFQSAVAFEESTAERYARMAEREQDAGRKELWAWLAEQERRHVASVRALAGKAATAAEGEPVAMPALPPRAPGGDDEVLRRAVRHEHATADFYEALAADTPLPSAAATLRALARDERGHAKRLEAALGT